MTLASTPSEKSFVDRRRPDWERLDALIDIVTRRGVQKLAPGDVVRVSPLYRSTCADLAAAQAARYSAPLVEYLLGLTASAHGIVYGSERRGRGQRHGERPGRAWLFAFPRAVRRFKWEMLLAAALFFVPLLFGSLLTLRDPTFAFRIVPESMLRPLADNYAKGFAGGREAGEGALMAGFYVNNNVGIALRCFALGIFGGLGSAFYLVQNGLSIGAILGYVASQGAGANIVVFILGHGSLELGAIVLAGGAGLSMGWSVIAPGELPRVVSLQRRAREILVVVAGASVMLLMAAAIEAFWSGSSVPNAVKIAVGGTLLVLVSCYVLFVGRVSGTGAGTASFAGRRKS